MMKKITALVLVVLVLSMNTLATFALTIGTGDNTYDFGSLNEANDSAGAGYERLGDKFKVPNDMYVPSPSAPAPSGPNTGIFWKASGTTVTEIIKAEGGSTCKSFTFKDLGISGYDTSGYVYQFVSCQLVLKDNLGGTLDSINLGASGVIPNTSVINLSTLYGRAEWSVAGVSSIEFTFTLNNGIGAAFLNLENIKIASISNKNYKPAPPTIGTQPMGASVNPDTLVQLTVAAGVTSGLLSYQWYSNTVNANTGGDSITGAIASTYSFTTSTLGTVYYYCVVTNTDASTILITAATTSNTAAVVTNVLVNAETPAITAQPQNRIATVGDSTSLSVAAAVATGTLSYQWYRNTSNSNSGGVLLSGAGSATYSFAPSAVGILYYYCVVTNTDATASGSKTAAIASTAAKVTATHPDGTYNFGGFNSTPSSGGAGYQAIGELFRSPNSQLLSAQSSISTDRTALFTNTGATALAGTATIAAEGTDACKTFTFNDYGISAFPMATKTYHFTALQLVLRDLNGDLIDTFNLGTSGVIPEDAIINLSTLYSRAAWNVTGVCSVELVFTFNEPAELLSLENITISDISIVNENAPAPVIGTQPVGRNVLVDASANLTVAASSSSGTLTYQWYSNDTNSNVGGDLITGAVSATYAAPTSSAGTTYYYCVVTNTDPTASVSTTATAATQAVAVTVEEPVDAVAPTIDTQPVGKSVLVDAVANITVAASVASGTLSYQWYSNAVNSNTGGDLITGAVSATYGAATSSIGTTYYYCVVKNTDSTATGSTIASTTSQAVAVTVSEPVDAAAPSIDSQPAGKSVTVGATANLMVSASVASGTLSYQWYNNVSNSNTGGDLITGAVAATYGAPTTSAGTTYYYCVVTNTDGTATGSTTASTTTLAVPVTVIEPVDAVAPTIDTQPVGSTVLVGVPVSLTIAASVSSGTLSFQWYSNAINSNTGGNLITGAVAATYVAPTTSAGTTYYYCVVTNTDGTATGSTTATTATAAVAVTVDEPVDAAAPTIDMQPIGRTVLVNASVTLTVSASVASGTLSYQWYSNVVNSNAGGDLITAAVAATYGAPTTSAGTTYYYCVVTNTDGTATGSITATTATLAVAVTVNEPVDAVTPTIDTQPIGRVVLVGAPASFTVVASVASGTLSYQWYSNAVNSNTGGDLITGAESASYAVPTTSAGTTYYYCVVNNTDGTATGSTTASTKTQAVAVTVVEIVNAAAPVIETQPTGETIQIGESASLSVAASTPGGTLTYQWYSSSTASNTGGSSITGARSASYTVPTSAAGTKYYYCIVTNTDPGATGDTTAAIATIAVAVTVLPAAISPTPTPTPTPSPTATPSPTPVPTNPPAGSNIYVLDPNITMGTQSAFVDMTQGSSILSRVQLNSLAAGNRTLPVVITGNGFTITFPAGTMKAGADAMDVDFGMQFNNGGHFEAISGLAGSGSVLVVRFNHSGPLPGEAVIILHVGTQYAGMTLHYYLFNPSAGKLEFRQSAVVDAKGDLMIRQSTCSEYLLTTKLLTPEPEATKTIGTTVPVETTLASTATTPLPTEVGQPDAPNGGTNAIWIPVVAGLASLAAAVGIGLYVRGRRNKRA